MKRTLVLTFLGCVLAGCSGVGSVYPIYTEKDTVFLPELLGTWPTEDGKDTVISRGEGNSYKISFWEGKDPKMVTVNFQLTKIGNTLFADMFSEKCEISDDAGFAMPVHLFAKMEIENSRMRMGLPSTEWFNKYLSSHPRAVDHLKYEKKGEGYNWIYLTDSTKHVRSFLKKVAKFPEAFPMNDDWFMLKVSESQTLPPMAVPPAESEAKPRDCCQGKPEECPAK